MKTASRIPDYLSHILQAIEKISHYTADLDEVGFLQSSLIQDAVLRNIEIIGEASNNIRKVSPEFTGRYPEVPWEGMYLMRNRLAHGYDTVDLEVVWITVGRDLPLVYAQVKALHVEIISNKNPFSF